MCDSTFVFARKFFHSVLCFLRVFSYLFSSILKSLTASGGTSNPYLSIVIFSGILKSTIPRSSRKLLLNSTSFNMVIFSPSNPSTPGVLSLSSGVGNPFNQNISKLKLNGKFKKKFQPIFFSQKTRFLLVNHKLHSC